MVVLYENVADGSVTHARILNGLVLLCALLTAKGTCRAD